MLRHSIRVFITAAVLFVPGEAPAAVTAWREVRFRLYDGSGQSAADRAAAIAAAAAALGSGGLEAVWIDCSHPASAPEGCRRPATAGELTIRVIRRPVPAGYRGTLALGDSLLEGGAGEIATVYYDRVAWLAQAGRGDRARLLGHAIAHEIGHLLLATGTHARTGLMRAVWSAIEIARRRPEDWRFTARDASAMQARADGQEPLLPRRSSSLSTMASAISFFDFRR